MKKNGFTLIELLIVIVIMSLLVTVGSISYQSINKQGRDSRRKADLEQIRGALELYRSNNGVYPTPDTSTSAFGMNFGVGQLVDSSSNTYLSRLPQDPKSSQSYYYAIPTQTPSEYVIFAKLDTVPAPTCAVPANITPDCEQTAGAQACNYCLGPYGQK